MASVPGGDDPTPMVRAFYTQHAGVVVAAQVLGLVAAATFVRFALTARRTAARRTMGALEIAGVGVAAAALLTAVPVLWLTAVADNGADGLVHALAVASDLTDVLLFAAIATWPRRLPSSSPSPSGSRRSPEPSGCWHWHELSCCLPGPSFSSWWPRWHSSCSSPYSAHSCWPIGLRGAAPDSSAETTPSKA